MREHLEVISAIGLGLGLEMAFAQGAVAQQNPVIAIGIALEPDATMVPPLRNKTGRQPHGYVACALIPPAWALGVEVEQTGL